MNRTVSTMLPILDSICRPAAPTAPVDVLAVLRRAANLAYTISERLATDNPPGHCDYISKKGASSNCKRINVEIEEARATVAELIEAAKALESTTKPDSYREEMRPGDGCTEIIGITEWSDEVTRLRAAIARVSGETK